MSLKTLEIGCIRLTRGLVMQRITFFKLRAKHFESQFWRRTKHQGVLEFVAVPKIRRICHSLICCYFICCNMSSLVASDGLLGSFLLVFSIAQASLSCVHRLPLPWSCSDGYNRID